MIISFYIKRLTPGKKPIIIKYIRDIYAINNLKINLFIKINILKFKEIIINLLDEKIIFIKCGNIIISI